MEDVRRGGDEGGQVTLAFVEQCSALDVTIPMSRARLGVGAMKGTLASSQVLTTDGAASLLSSDVFKHQNLRRASHFFLTSSSCSLRHWWATCFQAGVADDGGGGEVKAGRIQNVGGYMARFMCGEGRSGFGKITGRCCDEGIENFKMR